MDLNQWIDQVSGNVTAVGLGMRHVVPAATLLNEKPRTVYSWYRRERAPGLLAAMNIVKASKGTVDYNGIFEAFEAVYPLKVGHDRF